jgi:outer membrane receptor protein involved in Fe transport
MFGFLFTPRLHFKYDITPKTIARISAGKGYRSPLAIAENISLLASSREFIFLEQLTMEEAWNYGINITQYVDILGRELTISGEFYRTQFVNQAVVDRDIDDHSVYFYNLDGKSFANIFQIEAKYEILPRLEMVAAFRLNDVQTTTDEQIQRETFVDRYKGMLSLSYQTRMKKWQFDFTSQFNGQSRLPFTGDYPEQYRRGDSAPAYTILNAQVTKYFKRWDLYVGGENLTNYRQDNPIIASDDPFGEYFDASQIWGPVVGMKIYAGMRWKLKK